MGFDKNFQEFFVLFSPVHDYHHTTRQQTNPLCFQFCLENKSRPKILFSFLFSQCYGFYLSLKPGLHFFLHNNKWQCNSFFCIKKEIYWDFVVQENFFAYVHNLESPTPLYAIVRTWLDLSPPPLCVRTMWITPNSCYLHLIHITRIFYILFT